MPRPGPPYHRERPGTHLYRRLDGPQGRSGQLRKISPLPGFDPRSAQPVVSRYTDCAIAAHIVGCSYIFELSHNIQSKWQLLDCASIAFS